MIEAIVTLILSTIAEITEEPFREELRSVRGIENDIKKLESEFKSIKAVLVDAERRRVKEESVKVWLEKLRDVCDEAQGVLAEWITTATPPENEDRGSHQSSLIKKVCFFFTNLLYLVACNRLVLRRDIALKIKRVNERLHDLAVEKDRYKFVLYCRDSECSDDRPNSTSYVDESEVQGRNEEKETVIRELLSDKNQNKALNVVSIVGEEGIGKTTVAQLVYNSSDAIEHFDRRIWVHTPDPFDEIRIAKAILEDITESAPCLFELETIARQIRNSIGDERLLIVLDDVFTDDFRKWEQLFNFLRAGAAGSTILVTTTKESVANSMGSNYQLPLGKLSDIDSWSLFQKIAFFDRNQEECEGLGNVGRMIAEKCDGSPFTIKKIGTRMRLKRSLDDWEDVLKSDQFWD